jgi:siroheme synthase-like protein
VAAGAEVTVVDPAPAEEVVAMAASGEVALGRHEAGPGDLEGAFLVVTATDDPAVNAHLAAEAGAAGALVARADHGTEGDVMFCAEAGLGPVRVAVSTAGRAPVVAAWVAERLAERLPDVLGLDADGVGELVAIVTEVLDESRGAGGHKVGGADEGRPPWRRSIDREMLDLVVSGRRAEAKERFRA